MEDKTFQSTHPARGGTRADLPPVTRSTISIHPPRTGWDYNRGRIDAIRRISIHPPRTGWDRPAAGSLPRRNRRFQSTHPARGGTEEWAVIVSKTIFQSTHPARGGTKIRRPGGDEVEISIHPPRTGWDK